MVSGYPDYEGQKSRLFTVADWAAVEATDINLWGAAVNQARGGFAFIAYVVPAGQTLYVVMFTGASYANLAASGDLNQICYGWLLDFTTGVPYCYQGGNGGFSAPLTKPVVIPGPDLLQARCYNQANHNCDLTVYVGGYLI